MIQQSYGLGEWKLPGGLVDSRETLGQAVVREVYEETGVNCEFRGILGFRERNGYISGKNDMYFVALCTPTSSLINPCPKEILNCEWKPFTEALSNIKNEAFGLLKPMIDPSLPILP